jgi:hypothetical protein
MFREIRFQTGEVREVAEAMKAGSIPHLEVNYMEEFEAFAGRLQEYGLYRAEELAPDKTARDRIAEPEFEFRAAFRSKPAMPAAPGSEGLMYIDVYFEEEPEESYDPVGEM